MQLFVSHLFRPVRARRTMMLNAAEMTIELVRRDLEKMSAVTMSTPGPMKEYLDKRPAVQVHCETARPHMNDQGDMQQKPAKETPVRQLREMATVYKEPVLKLKLAVLTALSVLGCPGCQEVSPASERCVISPNDF